MPSLSVNKSVTWSAFPLPVQLGCLGIILLLTTLASLSLGYDVYSAVAVWNALLGADSSQTGHIIRDLRLPRAVLAPLTGAALGIAGVVAQTLARNRVASPDILGLNAGAALAVVIASVWFGVGALGVLSAAAMFGALAAGLLVFTIGQLGGGMSPARIVLAGIMLSGFMSSFVQVVLTVDEKTMEELLFGARRIAYREFPASSGP